MHNVTPHPNRIITGSNQRENSSDDTSLSEAETELITANETNGAAEFGGSFANARHWFYILDSQGNFLATNPSGLKLLGYSAAEAQGLTLDKVAAPEARELAKSLLQQTFAEGSVPAQELECRTKLGEPIFVEVSLWVVAREYGGRPVAQGMARDISYRRQAQIEADCQQALLRSLLESSPDSIYFKDRQSRFIECSAALARKFGVTREQLIGTTDFDHHQDLHASQAYADEQDIIRTGQPIVGKVEHEGQKNGEECYVLTAKMPFRNKAGEIIGTFGISKDISKIKAAEAKLEKVHKQLLETSHQAGRAEVATSVLHNVGNVLNSVNVSSLLVSQKIRNSKLSSLGKMAALLQEQAANLAGFVANDPRGRQLPEYLAGLAVRLANEQKEVLAELEDMNKNVEHIKEIVAMQQNYARVSGVAETVPVIDLVEDAIRMNVGAMERHSVQLVRAYAAQPVIMVEKHKVLQILVNLIRNAKYALDDCSEPQKLLTLKVGTNAEGMAVIIVLDNGVGIPAENLTRIFGHGFTTRKDGHGFGLHSGALAAKELGGSLTAKSEGRAGELSSRWNCRCGRRRKRPLERHRSESQPAHSGD